MSFDLVNGDREYPLKKKLVVGQITICRGCCCGNTERGLPDVPVEWLKSEWRKRGLLKRVQLTISGCVGPCDVPNVVVITTSSGTEWLGNIDKVEQYIVSCWNGPSAAWMQARCYLCRPSFTDVESALFVVRTKRRGSCHEPEKSENQVYGEHPSLRWFPVSV